jgi:hypothetical protein
MTALRILLGACALATIVFAVSRAGDVRSCDDARRTAFALVAATPAPPPPADGGTALANRLIATCRGSDGLVASAGALQRVAALDGAERLARVAVRRDPASFQARNALARVLDARGDPEGAAAQRRRAFALNPLAPRPVAPRIGPDGRPLGG